MTGERTYDVLGTYMLVQVDLKWKTKSIVPHNMK